MSRRITLTRLCGWVPLAAAVSLAACGGSEGAGGGGGDCTPRSSAAFSISASGLSPMAVCVLPNGTVTFTNGDAVEHDVRPTGAGCAELDLGVIAPGASRSATFPTVGVCTFHDAQSPSDARFQGTVAVTTQPAEGPGY